MEISVVHIRTILMERLVYPDAHKGNIHRMRNYRSPDVQLQITKCAHLRPEMLPEVPGGFTVKIKVWTSSMDQT